MKPGRHPRGSVRFVISMRLDPELDADLLEWLRNIPVGERVKALKRALRSGGVAPGASMEAQDDREAQEAAENILGTWNF
jgi:hypothetical protein